MTARKRILFVDDERAVLDGLRQRLFRMRDKWDMCFVESGALAIEALESRPFDLLVTDVRMPEMDGSRLLEIVAQRWPETARIVLSGYADATQLMRPVPLAHQYLTKPCEPERLESVIEQCARLQDVLRAPELRLAVGKIRKLPAIPQVYQQLNAAMTRAEVAIPEIAAIVSKDCAVTAKLLQVVNSAFFRLPRRVTSVEQAVTHLGMSSVRNLVVCAEVFCNWSGVRAPRGMEPERLQSNAQAVAAGARALAGRCSWADDALLAGLLHDIGHWVLLQQCPEEMAHACEVAHARGMELHLAERDILGTTHAEVGAYLLGLWGLPYPILEAVAFHHEPKSVLRSEFGILATVAIAESLIDPAPAAEIGPEYLSSLNSPLDWSEAESRVAQAMGGGDP